MANYVDIPAFVESATPEPNEFKPFSATLTFDHKVCILVPVPASEVEKKGDRYVLTLEGWKHFLLNYSKIVKQLPQQLLK